MKRFYFLILISSFVLGAGAQDLRNSDKKAMKRMKATIEYLASDKLEGRRTGSEGEKLAANYIIDLFTTYNIQPKGSTAGSYLQPFEVDEGREVKPTTAFYIDEVSLIQGKDFFPLSISANTGPSGISTNLSFQEPGKAWMLDLKDTLLGAKINPHFDIFDYVNKKAAEAEKAGATAVIFYNTGNNSDELSFLPKDKSQLLGIPVVYLKDKQIGDKVNIGSGSQLVKLIIETGDKKTTGNNVVGFIDNKAATTIVIGAHYDHLGYGRDHNSLYVGKDQMIHNGADDNASGVSGLLELARYLKKSPLRSHNYLFVAFSGEELGLYGSKYFVKNAPVDVTTIDFMINMDMIGRLNPETKGLTVGGVGTSPFWKNALKQDNEYFKVKYDSSGIGPSDHTSFYLMDIPVLFFFTGTHSDYHKPTDDAEKINIEGAYRVVKYIQNIMIQANYEPKIAFTKTRDVEQTRTTFKVSLGVMPDYTFSGQGVLVDGVSEGKAASKAGIQKGDVLIQLGDFKFTDVQTYMGALNKFDKGDTTTVKFMRGGQEMEATVTF